MVLASGTTMSGGFGGGMFADMPREPERFEQEDPYFTIDRIQKELFYMTTEQAYEKGEALNSPFGRMFGAF